MIKLPVSLKRINVKTIFNKNFIERSSQKEKFNEFLNKVLSFHGEKKESSFLVFSGSGGFGKSAFLTELSKGLSTNNVTYNFSNGNELVTVLRELRTMLSNKYGMLFPLFDKGYVHYRLKYGDI